MAHCRFSQAVVLILLSILLIKRLVTVTNRIDQIVDGLLFRHRALGALPQLQHFDRREVVVSIAHRGSDRRREGIEIRQCALDVRHLSRPVRMFVNGFRLPEAATAALDGRVHWESPVTEKCRWCGMNHETVCLMVKAIEYFDDGVTVKRVEFKVASDYGPMLSAAAAPFPLNPGPSVPQFNILGTNPDGTPRYVDLRAHGG